MSDTVVNSIFVGTLLALAIGSALTLWFLLR